MADAERAPAAGAQEPRFDTALLDLCREFGLTGAQFSAMLEAATAPATEPQKPAAWLVGTAVGPCPMLHYPEHFAATGWSVAPLYTRPAPQVAEPPPYVNDPNFHDAQSEAAREAFEVRVAEPSGVEREDEVLFDRLRMLWGLGDVSTPAEDAEADAIADGILARLRAGRDATPASEQGQ